MAVPVHDANRMAGYSTDMVTRIGRRAPPRVFLKEWRESRGLSAEQMAGRLEIERESYYRWEREPHRINVEKMIALAGALDIEPEELWRQPAVPSLDVLTRDASAEQQAMVFDIVRRVMGKAN